MFWFFFHEKQIFLFFVQFILTSEEFANEPAVKRFSVVSRGDRNFGESKKLSMSPAHGEGEKFIQSDVHRVSTYCTQALYGELIYTCKIVQVRSTCTFFQVTFSA